MKYRFGCLAVIISSTGFSQIRISEPVKHLGDVLESQGMVQTTFDLFNPYPSDTIRIVNIETSCGCTAILTTDRVIMPRQTLPLKVAYDPARRPGVFLKTILVETITGADEHNSIYLKITGNVVSSTLQSPEIKLSDYRVAPVFFLPVTTYDTSYLDLDYLISFINDLTYEIDHHQIVTIGSRITIDDESNIAGLENLMRFMRRHIYNGMRHRGYDPNRVIFENTEFDIGEIPVWATARVKLFSWNFNDDSIDESEIETEGSSGQQEQRFFLDCQRFQLPTPGEIVKMIDFKSTEAKLFSNSRLDLKASIEIAKGYSLKKAESAMTKLRKNVYRYLKKSSGIAWDEISFQVDTILIRTDNRFILRLWDKSDEKASSKIIQVHQKDNASPPLLPTCRQFTWLQTSVDMASRDFRRMWKNVILNNKAGREVSLMVESSVSYKPMPGREEVEKIVIAREIAQSAKALLQRIFSEETGRSLPVDTRSIVHGPPYAAEYYERVNYDEFEYITIMPIVKSDKTVAEPNHTPYQVNFDYYFNGIDTASLVFHNFARKLGESVHRDGFVEIRIESSISQVPIERNVPNEYLCVRRSLESQLRLRAYLARNLVDPNRLIILEERNLIQGPEYNRKTAILAFRPYQYLRIIPEKFLRRDP